MDTKTGKPFDPQVSCNEKGGTVGYNETATVATTALEYLTSWALESVFQTKWWDYSDLRFNVRGRVCLRNSLLFGLMGVLAVRFVHPRIVSFIAMFPDATLETVAFALAVALVNTWDELEDPPELLRDPDSLRRLYSAAIHAGAKRVYRDGVRGQFDGQLADM